MEGTSRALPQRTQRARGRACFVLGMIWLIWTGAARAQASEPAQAPAQSSGQTSGQGAGQLPEAPDESKKKSDNPVVVTKDAATAGLKKARDWESGWIAGEYIGRNRKLVSPTREQREEIYLRQTLTTPEAYMKRMFAAAIDQARGTPWQWGGGWGGYGKRFASREGQFISANTLAAAGNAMLGYEVRYDQCKCQGLWPRTRHAFIRNLVTYDRSEEHLAAERFRRFGSLVRTMSLQKADRRWGNRLGGARC